MMNRLPSFLRFEESSLYFRFLTRFAPMYVINRMTRIVEAREPEMELLHILCDPHEIAIDVGVLWGAFANRLQHVSKYCIAIEANPRQIQFLEKHLANDRIRIINAALSDSEGISVLRVPVDTIGHGTIENCNKMESVALRKYEVECRPLDSYDLEPVAFIKIDVEGHEYAVLKGMTRILERYKPNLIVEMTDRYNGESCNDILAMLSGLGYVSFVYVDGRLMHIQHYNVTCAANIFDKGAKRAHNFTFIHTSNLERFRPLLEM